MSITTIGSHLIHYEALGRGRPIVFIHGWLGSWRYWWPSMQALSTHHRAFAFDLWGFGDSSKESNPAKAQELYNFSTYVDMLDKFLDQLGINQPVTLVGHSLGAAIALRYASKYLGRVERLVTVALPVQGAAINERLMNMDPESFINRVVGKSNSFPEVDNETRKIDSLAVSRVANELAGYDFRQEVDECPHPLLLVYGEQDPVIQQPPSELNYLRQATKNRYYINLDDCNHFPMLQQTAQFNRLVLDFINSDGNLTNLAPKEYWQRRTR